MISAFQFAFYIIKFKFSEKDITTLEMITWRMEKNIEKHCSMQHLPGKDVFT